MKFQRCLLFLWIIEEVIYEIIKLYKNLKEEIIMGNLFGYKKWYKVDKIIKDKKGKESTIKQEVRIKRNYTVDRYTLNTNNKEKNNINNEDFVNQFIEYKTNNDIFRKFTRKFHAGNILFKLKGNKRSIEDSNGFLKTEEIILNKEVYGQSEK